MKSLLVIIIFLLLAAIVDIPDACARYTGKTFHTGYPDEPIQGYFQPVMIRSPEGTRLAGVSEGRFSERFPSPFQIGMLVGNDYRFRITDIPFNPGREIFPTITLLARTYPPQGKELDFPITINLTLEDIELALAGQYITRVIYLENPKTALPIQSGTGEGSIHDQIVFDIQGGDPIAAAATQGLPVAIVRIGGRIPTQHRPDGLLSPEFCFDSPPWILNRTIPPERTNLVTRTALQSNTLTVDPNLKLAGQSILDGQQELLPNVWHPHHQTVAHGGRDQEYLFNGGDSRTPASVKENSWEVRHFETGDTLAHYDTLDGRVIIEASNPLTIYAPRFNAVRKVEGLLLEGQITGLAGTWNQLALSQNRETMQTNFADHGTGIRSARSRDQINRLDHLQQSAGTEHAQKLVGYDNFQVVDNNMVLMQRTLGLGGALQIHLENGALNAKAWQNEEGVRVEVNEHTPMSMSGIDGAAVYFQIEDKQGQTSKLRLIKVASQEAAQPGEIIEFTLRFDNVGNQLIGNVTILDGLAGRLEFLQGSATASLPSGFDVQRNDEGSWTLRFEITDPLEPGDFGVIRFQCRVR